MMNKWICLSRKQIKKSMEHSNELIRRPTSTVSTGKYDELQCDVVRGEYTTRINRGTNRMNISSLFFFLSLGNSVNILIDIYTHSYLSAIANIVRCVASTYFLFCN